MKWTPGPARCRSPEYEAEIAFTDMPGDYPLHGRIRITGSASWRVVSWLSDGRLAYGRYREGDLMPPIITREEFAKEIAEKFDASVLYSDKEWARIVAHVIDAVKAGRVE